MHRIDDYNAVNLYTDRIIYSLAKLYEKHDKVTFSVHAIARQPT